MSGNENFLGLGSLWDAEQMNIDRDIARKHERDRKSELYFPEAMLAIRVDGGVTVQPTSLDRDIHVRRIGMMWIEGVVCGSVERAIAPFGEIRAAFSPSDCVCAVVPPDHFEMVPLGAVLRDIERHASSVTITSERFGVRGRITGVWRDAISVRSLRREWVVPRSSLGVILVDDGARP